MDNIVDYLVVLFFIISFLSSIFKKKKKTSVTISENKALKVQNQNPNIVEKKRNVNPFEDFFKSINDEIVKAKTQSSRSEVDEYYEDAMLRSADAREFIEPLPEKISQKEKAAISIKSYDESLKQAKEKHESKKAKEIRNRLKKNTSIRDFIIISEILGKPKALQK